MKNMSRAIRRHHRARMINRALKYWVSVDFSDPSDPNTQHNIDRATRYHNHLAVCSCPMCRNQRHNTWLPKSEKGTMQERRGDEQFKYELKDIAAAI